MSNFSNFALKLANSNLASAFFGAILGAITLWSIEWIKEEHALIKDVNTSLAGLKYLSETLLNMKKQIVIPICQAYQNNIEQIRKSAGQPVHLNLSTNTYSAPRLSFNFPTNRIFSKVTVVPKIIDSIIYLQNSMEQLDHLWQEHNSLIEELRLKDEDSEKLKIFFGRYSNSIYQDGRYEDMIEHIKLTTDDTLFYAERAKECLSKIGNRSIFRKIPPCFLRPSLIDYSFQDSSYAELIPTINHIPGWGND